MQIYNKELIGACVKNNSFVIIVCVYHTFVSHPLLMPPPLLYFILYIRKLLHTHSTHTT